MKKFILAVFVVTFMAGCELTVSNASYEDGEKKVESGDIIIKKEKK